MLKIFSLGVYKQPCLWQAGLNFTRMEEQALTISAVLTVSIIVVGFLLKAWFNEILKKLDELVNEIKALNELKTIHDQQIKFLQGAQLATQQRLDNHDKRIRDLEIKSKNG